MERTNVIESDRGNLEYFAVVRCQFSEEQVMSTLSRWVVPPLTPFLGSDFLGP
jgi:hypothetical protein